MRPPQPSRIRALFRAFLGGCIRAFLGGCIRASLGGCIRAFLGGCIRAFLGGCIRDLVHVYVIFSVQGKDKTLWDTHAFGVCVYVICCVYT